MGTAAILDVDGTLVDSNYQHSIAWWRAFRQRDFTIPVWKIHRHIGMGGDQLVPALLGKELAAAHGEEVREAEKRLFAELIDEVVPLPGARELIVELKAREHTVVLASSAHGDDVERYLDLLDVRELADEWTTSSDVEATRSARPRSACSRS